MFCYRGEVMGVKRSWVLFEHDEGYGDDLLDHINSAIQGKDMQAVSIADGDLMGAANQAFGALVGASAKVESVQGQAKIRLRKALGISSR
jgi:hypothetical protein